jgi:hypothetical protein
LNGNRLAVLGLERGRVEAGGGRLRQQILLSMLNRTRAVSSALARPMASESCIDLREVAEAPRSSKIQWQQGRSPGSGQRLWARWSDIDRQLDAYAA